MIDKKFLLGVGITNATEIEVLEYILQSLEKGDEKYYVVTPNPELLVIAHKNPSYKKILNNARLALCDGMGIIVASRLLGKSIKKRITGVDFLESVCKTISEKPITVGFLGGGPGVAEKTAECLQNKYPGLRVVFAGSEWSDKLPKLLKSPRLPIDILFVAFGSPKQEEWISQNIDKLPVKVVMGVGGAFDFISGKVPRAPILIRKLGFEWLFRLILEPRRIKRQLALLEFIILVVREKLMV